MIGQTLGHYRIVEKIGAGGMGEVYRAHDERLDRDVALKVLPAGTLADESARRRFRKEALALSKLNHPNVETVHDFDTQDGVDFLVMEHIPGVTLDDKLAAGPLPEKEIARLAAQLAEGLAAAHAEGVVHRDLKPGNLRVTPDGRLKILDFGLAKLLRPVSATATTESLTETQAVPGTLPYMAPEQLQGDPADARTDLYAAGTVLYEMATGRRPFEQKLASALIADIVHTPPPRPSQFNPQVAPRLEEIILKCLEKEPENRYQSSKELGVDLRRLATPSAAVPAARGRRPGRRYALVGAGLGVAVLLAAVLVGLNVGGLRERLLGQPGPPKIDSLAVLPLENLSGDPEQEYFVDGMHEELIANLAKIRALKVISRTSVMRYKGVKKPLPEIARELGVEGVIEGSVRREGNQVRISVQLIDAATDRHLWAESYQRDLQNVLALQSEVAREIAQEIKVNLTPQEQVRLASARPVNAEAYELYLKGRYQWNKRTEEGLRNSIVYYQRAIETDPTYALAYAGLAESYNLLPFYSSTAPRETFPKAKEAARRALEIDDTLAEAHSALAYAMHLFDWDWHGSRREFNRALELKPAYATAHQWYADYLTTIGDHSQAIAEMNRARELDPLSLIINTNVGEVLYYARQYGQAIDQLRETVAMEPSFPVAHERLGLAYLQKGIYEQAIAEIRQAEMLSSGTPPYRAELGYAYALSGKRREAKTVIDQLRKSSNQTYVSSYGIAVIFAALGDNSQALAWLEKAYEERAIRLVWLKVEPAFDPLRDDSRFQELLRRMNFPE